MKIILPAVLIIATGLFLTSTAAAICLDSSTLQDPSILEIQDKVVPRPLTTIIYKYDISPCTNKPSKVIELTQRQAELTRIVHSWVDVSQERCNIPLRPEEFREAAQYVQDWKSRTQGPLSISFFKPVGYLTLVEGSSRKNLVASTDQPEYYKFQNLIDSIESRITEKDCSVIKYENTQPEF